MATLPNPAFKPTPPRSRLVGHVPAGVGTGRCEGLIGYLIRIARVHHVNPRELVRVEFLPHCRRTGGIRLASFFSDYARGIYGVGPYAEDFLRVTSRLTGRNDLRPLTLLPWRAIIPVNSARFLARQARWCRHCLLEERIAREYRPFPLVWALDSYQVCSTHLTNLENQCPSCGRPQPFIPYLPDQNHCNFCGQWLGFAWEKDGQVPISSKNLWIARALEDLVAASPGLDDESLATAWRRCGIRLVGQYGGGAKTVASRALGLTSTAFSTWLIKGQKPSFPQLLKLCRQLNQLPTELLGLRQTTEKNITTVTGDHEIKPVARVSLAKVAEIRSCLEGIVKNISDCRSMAEIRRDLGVSRGFLAYRFRELCRQQSAKHKKWRDAEVAVRRKRECLVVRQVVREIAQDGIYPARNRTDKALRAYKLSLIRQYLLEAYRQALEEEGFGY